MGGLARYLQHNGYEVLNLGYPSTKFPIEQLIDVVHSQIEARTRGRDGTIHFVGYSMGGLLIRAYIAKYKPHNVGRVVMLGTPNQGSEVADFLKRSTLYRWLYGAAGQQLITDQAEFVHLFGQISYELGVIAGNRPIDPISSRIINKPNDGKVSIESTKVEGMSDHIVIRASHTFFPNNRVAWRQTVAFLRGGRFERR